MGIIIDGLSISLGCFFGGLLSKRISLKSGSALAIGVMIISLVGFLENLLSISEDGKIVGEHTVTVVIALVLGCAIGDLLRIEEGISSLSGARSSSVNGFVDATLFFGIGGLQISGPILLALTNDSFQLILKAVIDLPFALMMGAAYGKRAAFSAIPVALMQAAIAILARLAGDFISDELLRQLCSIGYVILFFTGYNMISGTKNKVKNINMLPAILLIIIYNIGRKLLNI